MRGAAKQLSDEVVERVARALAYYEGVTSCKALGLEPQPLYADTWTKHVGRARAAIAAYEAKGDVVLDEG